MLGLGISTQQQTTSKTRAHPIKMMKEEEKNRKGEEKKTTRSKARKSKRHEEDDKKNELLEKTSTDAKHIFFSHLLAGKKEHRCKTQKKKELNGREAEEPKQHRRCEERRRTKTVIASGNFRSAHTRNRDRHTNSTCRKGQEILPEQVDYVSLAVDLVNAIRVKEYDDFIQLRR